jgi:uncharacterized protein (TIGR03083 family)
MQPLPIIDTAPLFRPLLAELLDVLSALEPADWTRPTVAGAWRVRDVAAHLLDVSLRRIAASRDSHLPPVDRPPLTPRDVAALVNGLNAAGVAWSARLSPRLIVDLLAVAGAWMADLFEGLPPHGEATFPVSWAGESRSENWMDTGREYTEHWHHQMQIRDAVGAPPRLLEPQWMTPLIEFSLRALPFQYAGVAAAPGAALTLEVAGPTAGRWSLVRGGSGWQLYRGAPDTPEARVAMSCDDVWRLFYNALPASRLEGALRVDGNRALAEPLTRTRSVVL